MAEKQQTVPIDQVAAMLTTSPEELTALARRGVIPKIAAGGLPLVKTVQAYTRHIREPLLSAVEVAAEIGKSRAWIRELVVQGYLKARDGGRFTTRDALAAQIAFLSDDSRRSSKSASAGRMQEARAAEIEIRTAERLGTMQKAAQDEAIAVVDAVLGPMRSDLQSVPARATKDLALRKRLEMELNVVLDGAADRAAAYRRGGGQGRRAVADAAAAKPGRVGEAKPGLPAKRRGSGAA